MGLLVPKDPLWSFLERGSFNILTGKVARDIAATLRRHAPYVRSVLQPVLYVAHQRLQKYHPVVMPKQNLTRLARSRLLIDVSTTFHMEQTSGIQRTVRSLVSALKKNAEQFDLEPLPVRLHRQKNGLRLVTAKGFPELNETEEDVILHSGDHVFMLDSTWDIYDKWSEIFPSIRSTGGKIITCVYDILPITHPQFFPKDTLRMFGPWFRMACAESDALLSISKATQDDIGRQDVTVMKDFFHLGADFVPSALSSMERSSSATPNFLMVGTIEPRKGHQTVLDAFEGLWQSGATPSLTFVGRPGWKVEKLVRRMRMLSKTQPLFSFLEGANDETLSDCYEKADVIIAASVAEGFGLPIVEALMKDKRVIASDIPAFREIANDAPDYFIPSNSSDLANVVSRLAKHPLARRASPKWLTWDESAAQLMMKVSQIVSR